jgi:membrane-associated phospholipid phosphatase
VRAAWLLGFVLVVGGLPMVVDRWVYDHVFRDRLYDLDWARLLREMGWYPTWAVAALALWLHGRRTDVARSHRDAVALGLAPAAAGVLCEVLKLLLRRERPELNAGAYGFRPWSDEPFSTVGLALPSSHTMVAFAAATVLARLWPGARWVWYALAAGCAMTRIVSRAHFVSDVTLGALLGWSVGWGMWIAMRPRSRDRTT